MPNGDWRPEEVQQAYRCDKTFDLPFASKEESPLGGISSGTIEIFWQHEPPKGWEVVKGAVVCRKL